MTNYLHRASSRFWSAVDSESVGLFQWLFYVCFIVLGIYALTIANQQAPLTLRSMGGVNIEVWYWLNIVGPGICLFGKLLRRSVFAHAGMSLELGGDIGVAFALAAYNTATVHAESWGRGMYGAFPLGTATFLSVCLLTVRDVRRMRRVELTK